MALAAAAIALFPLLFAAPAAGAAADQCVSLPAGPTPAVAVDLDGGDPEVYVPSIDGVTACFAPEVVLPDAPVIEREQCGGFGSCMKYYIAYSSRTYVVPGVSVCYSADGVPVCSTTDPLGFVVEPVEPGVMCVGYDLRGGNPCAEQ